MLVSRVEMVGFKSFAARTELQFSPGVSVLVGPNGSGKSNVADAVRWVLGEQSVRAVRARRAEDVIFGGSSTRQPLGLSEVTLVLDNAEGRVPLPYSEVQVTRRLYRSGESEYLLNGARVRLKDVIHCLAQAGLGPDGYCVIGQGAVEEFILQRPEERRLMLEAAANVRVYQLKLAETRSRLETTLQNLHRSEDTLAELEPHVRRLKGQAERAERAQQLRQQLFVVSRTWYQGSIRAASAALDAAERRAQAAQAALESRERDAEELRAEGRALAGGLSEAAQRVGVLRERLAALHSEREEAVRGHSTGLERLRGLRTRQETEAALAGQLASQYQRLIDEHTALSQQAEAKLAAASALERKVASVEGQITESARISEQARAALRRLERERDLLGTRLVSQESGLRDGYTRARLRERHQTELGGLESAHQVAAERLEAAERLAELRRQQVDEARTKREAMAQALGEACMAESRLEAEAGRARGLAAAATAASQAYGRALVARVPSVRDEPVKALTELLEVPPTYERAVLAALDALGTAWVVEKEALADELIRSREPSQNGQVTLVFVEPPDWFEAKATASESLAQALANIDGWRAASELVGCAPAYRSMMERCLRNTIVVSSCSEASRVAQRLSAHLPTGGWQVVSLDGEVWGWRGERVVGRGDKGHRLLLRHREKLRLEAEAGEAAVLANKAEEAHQSARTRREAVERELRQGAEQEEAAVQADLQAKATVRLARQEHESLRVDLGFCRQQLGRAQADNRELGAADAKSPLAQLNSAHHEAEAAALRALDEVSRAEAVENELRPRLDGLRRELASLDAEAGALQQLVRWRLEEAERAGAGAAEAGGSSEALEGQIRAASVEVAAAEALLGALSEQIEPLEQALSQQQRALEQAADARQALEQRLAEAQRGLSAARQRYEEHRLEVERARMEVQRLSREAQDFLVQAELVDEASVPVQMWLGLHGPEVPREDDDPGERDLDTLRQRLLGLQRELRSLGAVGPGVLEEYRQLAARVDFLASQGEDLRLAMARLTSAAEDLERTIAEKFKGTVEQVNLAFQESFVALFGGGTAQLLLSDEQRGSESGIEVVVRPPGKRLQGLMSLSGGERALASIALLFGLLVVNPAPFVLLDEVDAALDEANVQRFACMLRKYAERIQFLLVTHNRATMELADALFGVTMDGAGVSRVLSLRLADVATAS